MNSLWIRLISAGVGLSGLFATLFYFQESGLRLICLLAVIMGTPELISMLFRPQDSTVLKLSFFALMLLVFGAAVEFPSYAAPVFTLTATLFFVMSLSLLKYEKLEEIATLQWKAIFGFVYIGLMPAFACRLLDLDNGIVWFLALLSFVFSADSAAYFAGRWFGRRKLSPQISPSKTLEGAAGGVLGSLLAGFVFTYFIQHIPVPLVLLVALITGVTGQFGDLFESLLKRVAQIKDSGTLIPGHGGVLDRLDGVLFASPAIFICASVLETLY
jgi:phosphatidate cytidylyltransferase